MVKNLPVNAGDLRGMGLTPGSRRSPGEGNGSILAWRIPMDREDWWPAVHGIAESNMTEATGHR